jgi:hypothetical protein
MMLRRFWLLRDRANPGRYEIATHIEHDGDAVVKASLVPWRVTRR